MILFPPVFLDFMRDPWLLLIPLALFTGMAIIAWRCSPGITNNFLLLFAAIVWWIYAALELDIYWRQTLPSGVPPNIRVDLLFIANPISLISILALINFLIVLAATIIRLIHSNRSAHVNSSAHTKPKGPLRSWQDADDPKA